LGGCPAITSFAIGSTLRHHRHAPIARMGIRDKPTAPALPWHNGFAERLIGSIRRECVDHFVVLGEAHPRGILRALADFITTTSGFSFSVHTGQAIPRPPPAGHYRRAVAAGPSFSAVASREPRSSSDRTHTTAVDRTSRPDRCLAAFPARSSRLV
jgi:transposase InsO family protein